VLVNIIARENLSSRANLVFLAIDFSAMPMGMCIVPVKMARKDNAGSSPEVRGLPAIRLFY
jgi:hypothetical protein